MLGLARHAPPAPVVLAVEHWDTVADEAPSIGAEHFAEVENGLDPRRRFAIDHDLMRALDRANMLLICTARVDGALVGYVTWQIQPDPESQGLLIAVQGAWFVRAAFSSFHIGTRLYKASIEQLKKRGVQCCFPHHRMMGRGLRLGLFFQRLGAVLTKKEYMLWIGEGSDAKH